MPKKGSAFRGTGRKVDTGEKVIQKGKAYDAENYSDSGDEEDSSDEEAMRQAELVDEEIEKEERQEEARKNRDTEASMSSEEEDQLEGEESKGNLSHEDTDEEGDDYYEVIDRNNNCIKMLKGEDDDTDESAMEARIQNDDRFEDQNNRRRYNMGMIINKAVANTEAQGRVLDCSDTAPEKSRGTKVKMEPCNEGRFISVPTKTGKLKYRELQQTEITNLDSLAPESKCLCRVCTRRRQNVGDRWTNYGRTESRSGLKRGMYKYGDGMVLGDSNE